MGYTFKIVLDSPTNSYYAGTTVTGRVVLTLDKSKTFRGLKIQFEGKASVSWLGTETIRKNDGDTFQENVNYTADEQYFSNSYYLLGSSSGEIEIPAGEHVYSFTTTLPPQLPSSFEGEHGHVRYTIVATLDRPWKVDYEAKAIFQVVTPLDLNYHALAKEQLKKEVSKTFCCFCCKSGPLTLVTCVPQTGYVPGQDIPVTIEVDNASNVTVESITVKLKKTIKWTARLPKTDTKYDNLELSKVSLEGVEVNGSKSLTQNINVPVMPFVNLDACSIIDVSFILKVTACVSGMCKKNLFIEIPIIIGTVPIHQSQMTGNFITTPQPVGPSPVGGGDSYGLPQGGGGSGFATNGNFGQPGYPNPPASSPPPPVGFNATEPAPGANIGFVQPGGPQTMYPQPLYPDLNIDKILPPGGSGGTISPTAPPPETAPLMPQSP